MPTSSPDPNRPAGFGSAGSHPFELPITPAEGDSGDSFIAGALAGIWLPARRRVAAAQTPQEAR